MKDIKKALCAVTITTFLVGSTGCANKDQNIDINKVNKLDGGNYNIVFITTDEERYFEQFPEGSAYEARELMQRIGTTFEKAYVCSNMSSASRSVIYTGRHITETELHDNTTEPQQDPMNPEIPTVGDMMRDLGYYTAYKGKAHFRQFSTTTEDGIPIQTQNEMEQYGFADWNPDGDYHGRPLEGYRKDPLIVASSVNWLRQNGSTMNKEGTPFLLAINLINPHDVMFYNVDPEGVDVRDDGTTLLPLFRAPKDNLYAKTYPDAPLSASTMVEESEEGRPANYAEYNAVDELWFGEAPNTEEEWNRYKDYYYNCIQDNDDQLMNILNELENLNMMDNTIIVFTSDHGDMQGSHNLRGKGGFVYENNIHVPLIIVHPDYEGGQKVNSIVSLLDLAPTFVDFTKADQATKDSITKDLKGKSLIPLLSKPDAEANAIRPGVLYAFGMLEVMDGDGAYVTVPDEELGFPRTIGYKIDLNNRGVVRGIFDGQYKFARYFAPNNFNTPTTIDELYANNDVELFDLSADPDEMVNLAADKETNADLIMALNKKLNELIAAEIGVDNGKEYANIPIKGGLASMDKGQ